MFRSNWKRTAVMLSRALDKVSTDLHRNRQELETMKICADLRLDKIYALEDVIKKQGEEIARLKSLEWEQN